MRSCDTCPGGEACAGDKLTPVLLRVFDLYAGGMTDKFEILFALDEAEEKLLETCAANVERSCWTKAGMGAIAELLVRRKEGAAVAEDWPAVLEETLSVARDAFARFPWRLTDLVEQAPALHETVLERSAGDGFSDTISKRVFTKACKTVVYGDTA
jgi:hypothetical protein